MNRYVCAMKDKERPGAGEISMVFDALNLKYARLIAERQYPEYKVVKVSFLEKIEIPQDDGFDEISEV